MIFCLVYFVKFNPNPVKAAGGAAGVIHCELDVL